MKHIEIRRSIVVPGSGLLEFVMRIPIRWIEGETLPVRQTNGSEGDIDYYVGGAAVSYNEYFAALLTATAGRIDR